MHRDSWLGAQMEWVLEPNTNAQRLPQLSHSCAYLGTPWHRTVTASCAVSNMESPRRRRKGMPFVYGVKVRYVLIFLSCVYWKKRIEPLWFKGRNYLRFDEIIIRGRNNGDVRVHHQNLRVWYKAISLSTLPRSLFNHLTRWGRLFNFQRLVEDWWSHF